MSSNRWIHGKGCSTEFPFPGMEESFALRDLLFAVTLQAEGSRWLGRLGDLDRIGRTLDDPVSVVLGHPLVRSSGDLGNFIRMPSADQFDNRWHAFEGGFHTKFMFRALLVFPFPQVGALNRPGDLGTSHQLSLDQNLGDIISDNIVGKGC